MLEVGKFYIEPEQSAPILVIDREEKSRIYTEAIFICSNGSLETTDFNDHSEDEELYYEIEAERIGHKNLKRRCLVFFFEEWG